MTRTDPTANSLKISYRESTTNLPHTLLIYELDRSLTSLESCIRLLASEMREKKLKVYVELMKSNVLIVTNLVNELLKSEELSENPPESCAVNKLADDVLEIMHERIKKRNIKVKKEYVKNDTGFVMNRSKMIIALSNIVMNALDAMSPDTGELKLVTRVSGDQYVLEIWDNGSGMSSDTQENLFLPFFSTKPGALGLGLATAGEIFFRNNVHINVESVEGKGTGFILHFDARQANVSNLY